VPNVDSLRKLSIQDEAGACLAAKGWNELGWLCTFINAAIA